MQVVTRANLIKLFHGITDGTTFILIAVYAAEVLQKGASKTEVGIIASLFAAGAILGSLILGTQVSKRGVRYNLMTGFTIATIAYTLHWYADSPTTLMAARFLAGVAYGTLSPTADSFTKYYNVPYKQSYRYIPLGYMITYAIVILYEKSQMINEVINGTGGIYNVGFMMSIGAAITGLWLSKGLPPSQRATIDRKQKLNPGPVFKRNYDLIISRLLLCLGAIGPRVFIGLYVLHIGGDLTDIAYLGILDYAIQTACLYLPLEKVIEKPRHRIYLAYGLSTMSMALWLLQSVPLIIISAIIGGLAYSYYVTAAGEIITNREEDVATAFALHGNAYNIPWLIGPTLVGLLITKYSYADMIVAATITITLGGILYATVQKRKQLSIDI